MAATLKDEVRDYWNAASCGEDLYLRGDDYDAQAEARYALEPWIIPFARFEDTRGLQVLEVGIGLGAEHERFAAAGAILTGIDISERAVEHTRKRLERKGYSSDLRVADAENLPFPDASFDVVYSYGVIHHSPDTAKAARETLRVLRPGGRFAVTIYHRWSFVGLMLWLRYGLAAGKPLTPLRKIYAERLESPGTKAFSLADARRMFSGASELRITTLLSHADLLESAAGQQHRGAVLRIARKVWPRWLIKRLFPRFGLGMLIEGRR